MFYLTDFKRELTLVKYDDQFISKDLDKTTSHNTKILADT